jgi:hypothetical protein
MTNIPTFEVYIDEDNIDLGVDKISLVKKPAILENFIFLNAENEMLLNRSFHEVKLQEEKRVIIGPALIPNKEIIRRDEDGDPYYIKYSAEQIEKIAQHFFKLKSQYSINKDHKTDLDGLWIWESWIVAEADKSSTMGFDVPVGTWMVSLKVENEEVWEGIKSGKWKGFSIEGLFKFKKEGDYKKKKEKQEEYIEQERFLRRRLKSSNVDKVLYDSDLKELVIQFKEGDIYTYSTVEFSTFENIVTGLGGVCRTSGSNSFGEWEVGKTPSIGAAVWNQLIDLGVSYRKGGNINLSNLEKDIKNNVKLMVSAILKDGNTIYTDAEAMEVGVEVYFMDGEAKVAVEDGEYQLNDDSIVVVAEGKIAEIKEGEAPDAEPEVEAEDAAVNDMEAVKGMLENLNLKIDNLLEALGLTELKQSIADLDVKLEKVIVSNEMKDVKPVDDVKLSAETKKARLNYDLILKTNKKF